MKHVYLLCDGNYEKYACIFLKSLYAQCPSCQVLFNGYNVDGNVIRKAWPGKLQFYGLLKEQYVDRIATLKIERLADMPFSDGDEVLALDVDMIVQADPFKMFEETDATVVVTGRPVKFKHVINGGVWGFRFNKAGREFVKFHVEQVHAKDWKPYRNYLKKFNHKDLVNWSVGQDFLNTIYNHQLPFNCTVAKLGWEWNFCLHAGSSAKYKTFKELARSTQFKESERRYRMAISDPTIKIIHYKSKMKFLMEETPYAKDSCLHP